MGIGGAPHIKPNREYWVQIWARVYNASDSELSSLWVFNSYERLLKKKTVREREMDTPSNLDEQVST